MSVTYANNQFVAVGYGGVIATSPDGSTWTEQDSGTTIDLYGVAYGVGKIAAVGAEGEVLVSQDGVTWASENSNTSTDPSFFLYGITYGAGKFVAVGTGGVVTTEQVASTNANLSGLALSAGSLSPTFAATTTSYTASVANSQTSINVTPTLADTTATVTVNGQAVASGQAKTVSLSTGDNTITVVVTAQDLVTTKTYTITVTRALSSDSNLSALTLSSGTLSPSFDPATQSYTASVPYAVTSVNVQPTVEDSTATVKVNNQTVTSGQSTPVSLSEGANTITVVVTAQDGTTKTYTVTVTRQAASTNANLGNLTLSAGTLSPTFASGTYAYTADVDNATTSVDVTPTVADGTATVTVNGNGVTSGQAKTVSLNTGDNLITVVVTAQDGTTQKTYTVTVNRAKSSNADLNNLTLSAGTLSPTFASGTYAYTADVDNATTSVDVTPTVADGTATVTVNGNGVTSGQAKTVSLNTGVNTITVLVTAEDGTTQKTYTVTVNRAKSSNNNLDDLTINQGTLSPSFDSATQSYSASEDYTISTVDFTPTLADSTASVTVDGQAATSGQATAVHLNVGVNTINVVVTAEDGTTKTYTVSITRQAASTNADLNNLTLSAGTLSPDFATDTIDYSASVDYTTTHVDVTPTVADSTASVTVDGQSVNSGQATSIDLNVGSNTITVVVTAQDGTTQKTYTITINRAAPATNAALSDLLLNHGTLTPAFDPTNTSYTTTEANSISSIDVIPTLADSTATLTVNGSTAVSGQAVTVPLNNAGATTITIVVTAQDGVTTQTYTLVVNRLGASGGGGGGGGGGSMPPGNPGDGIGHVGDGSSKGNSDGNDTITKQIGEHLTMTGVLYSADGQPLNLPNIPIDQDGNFSLQNISPGTYQMVIYVTAPDGEKLAGQTATLTVDNSGQASVKSQLIDPFGTVRDSLTNQPLDGVKVSLYWADTAANRAAGHTPCTLVQLPELVNMLPNQNHNAQTTANGGQYGFMVFPQGDYYLIAEKDGYQTYDSRNDTRDETQGDTSYIRNGIIHVGETVVQMNFTMQAQVTGQGEHQPYISGYPDGTFRPNQSITRAELASILARILPSGSGTTNNMTFRDVAPSYWAAQAIAEVSGEKIMVGYPDGNFHPNQVVTRAEMAAVLAKLKQLPTGQGQGFTDIAGNWAENFILQVQAAGLVTGYPDGTYRPNQALTRAETVVILNKLLGRTPQQVTGSPKWSDVPATFWGYVNIMEASEAHSYQTLANGVEVWTN